MLEERGRCVKVNMEHREPKREECALDVESKKRKMWRQHGKS